MKKNKRHSVLSRKDLTVRKKPVISIPQINHVVPVAQDGIFKRTQSVDEPQLRQVDFLAQNAQSIGFQAASILSTNWLIDKCCSIPARDAVRMGYILPDELKDLQNTDKKYSVKKTLTSMIHQGKVYGGVYVLFDIESANPEEFYKNPFNIDGVKPDAYKGMVLIDPNWITPELSEANLNNPASSSFYNPTFYRINNQLYHKSHLHIYIPYPVTNYLKPNYSYLGCSLPQRIMERVYGAERSANEAPLLMLTKRLTSLKVGDDALANTETLYANVQEWIKFRDNYGIKILGGDEEIAQSDSSLSEVDSVIMTQYQLVASVANVPATKLLGTQPKGFNSTGEYEEGAYREELESIQENELTPLLEKHYEILAKSRGIRADNILIQWNPASSPSAEEWAALEKMKAERDLVLYNTGAIDAEDIRNRIRADKENDYFGIEQGQYEDIETEE